MNGLARWIDRMTTRVEEASSLDRLADAVSAAAGVVVPSGKVKDLASGTPTAHPLHPPLATATIGSFAAAALLDVRRSGRRAARSLIGAGIVFAAPTIYAGVSDWLHTAQAERRVGLVHAAVNDLALSAMVGSWWSRRRGRHGVGVALSATGMALLTVGGSLGGHLAYAMGVGVDTTAFRRMDMDWTDVAAESEVPADRPLGVRAGELSVVLARDHGRIVALVDRCTHRGAPLHQGTVRDGCVECPWHHSRFVLADGSIERGPAVRPQPVMQSRIVDGRVQVRRTEQRALRTRPVA